MLVYFAFKENKLVITKNLFKAQNGIGNHIIKKFNLYDNANTNLLKLLVKAYDTDSIIDRHLYLSNFIIHISTFRNRKFTKFITKLWLESINTLYYCIRNKHARDNKQPKRIIKKFKNRGLNE